jgi:Arc/MetJ-type ribon-helix-helix transcriptional regulator
MRTTVTIDESLYSEVKELAAKERSTVGSVIEEALRLLLREQQAHQAHLEAESAPLPTFPGKLNLPAGIDPHNTSQIVNYLDELDFLERNTGTNEHG